MAGRALAPAPCAAQSENSGGGRDVSQAFRYFSDCSDRICLSEIRIGAGANYSKIRRNERYVAKKYSDRRCRRNLYIATSGKAPRTTGLIAEFSPPATKGAWKETILAQFNETDGYYPLGPLVMDSAGNLYGTTWGAVFELSPPTVEGGAWTETTIYTFVNNSPIGYSPNEGLLIDGKGNLYGTTTLGGGCGSIFELSPPTSPGNPWTATALYEFPCEYQSYPSITMIGGDGTIYGINAGAGTNGYGAIFGLTPPSGGQSQWTMEVLYSFFNGSDGAGPVGIVDDHKGGFYGTAGGGSAGCGVVFELSPTHEVNHGWRETTLYTFQCGTDGAYPRAGVILDRSGNLYGVTTQGGNNTPNCDLIYGTGCGVAFKLVHPSSSGGVWTENVLYEFQGGSDGGVPYGALLFNRTRGELYGATSVGGDSNCSNFTIGCGVLFEIRP